MKTVFLLICILVQFHSNAQHVFSASLTLRVLDSTRAHISHTAILNNEYQVYVQNGDQTMYKESNMDSHGNIQVFRNDIMPDEVGQPWNIVLINASDTMFVQYHYFRNSHSIPLEIALSNGSYIYDKIQTTNSNLELNWQLIEFEQLVEMVEDNLNGKVLIDLLKSKRNQCISLINKREYKKTPLVTFEKSDSKK